MRDTARVDAHFKKPVVGALRPRATSDPRVRPRYFIIGNVFARARARGGDARSAAREARVDASGISTIEIDTHRSHPRGRCNTGSLHTGPITFFNIGKGFAHGTVGFGSAARDDEDLYPARRFTIPDL